MMRQLKGKAKKESAKDKKERKKEFSEARNSLFTVVLPVLGGILALVIAFVLLKTNLKW